MTKEELELQENGPLLNLLLDIKLQARWDACDSHTSKKDFDRLVDYFQLIFKIILARMQKEDSK